MFRVNTQIFFKPDLTMVKIRSDLSFKFHYAMLHQK